MNFSTLIPVKVALVAYVFLITACSDASNPNMSAVDQSKIAMPVPIELTVFKSKTCNCCQKWIDHAQDSGFSVNSNNVTFLADLKEDKGIAPNYQSCHTSQSNDGYLFEGHVPAKYIKQYLAKVPENSIGLSVPAMPVGTPGMD